LSYKNFLVTGPPRSGKTTLIFTIINELKSMKIKIAGVYCPEEREGYTRIGFKIINLKTGEEGILARKKPNFMGPKVGKYTVNLKDLDEIGTAAIEEALKDESDVIVIDEVGKMELKSKNFEKTVLKALNSKKPVIGVIHRKWDNPLLRQIKNRSDTQVYYIDRYTTKIQRQEIAKEIINKVKEIVDKNKRV